MRDFPVFTTEYGVASLVLKEIPYQQTAYIIIRDTQDPEPLLQECISFCRICGAEKIYATGHEYLEDKPLFTAIWEMRISAQALPETDAALWPVQEDTLDRWQELYNKKVVKVPNGAWMTRKDAQDMLTRGEGYFIHRGETLLGIGKLTGGNIDWVASCQSGAGRDVVAALARGAMTEDVTLTVASTNEKAVALYEALGFLKTREISRWYRV